MFCYSFSFDVWHVTLLSFCCRNYGQIIAKTPNFYDNIHATVSALTASEKIPGSPLDIIIIFKNPVKAIKAPESFVYKADPEITNFYPNDTIVE